MCTPLAPTRNKIIYKTACSDDLGPENLLKPGFPQKVLAWQLGVGLRTWSSMKSWTQTQAGPHVSKPQVAKADATKFTSEWVWRVHLGRTQALGLFHGFKRGIRTIHVVALKHNRHWLFAEKTQACRKSAAKCPAECPAKCLEKEWQNVEKNPAKCPAKCRQNVSAKMCGKMQDPSDLPARTKCSVRGSELNLICSIFFLQHLISLKWLLSNVDIRFDAGSLCRRGFCLWHFNCKSV